jgi:hypothetical protein
MTVVVVSLLVSCSRSQSTEAKLLGTWRIPQGSGESADYTFLSDHSFVIALPFQNPYVGGIWHIRDSDLTMEPKPPPTLQGEGPPKILLHIITLEGDTMVLRYDSGLGGVCKRVK